MMQSDSTTFELGQAKLRLKNGLTISLQEGKYENWYLIEDDCTGDCFRVGEAEYAFLSVLDGTTNVVTAIAITASRLGAKAINEKSAIELCRWLVHSGLATTRASESFAHYEDRSQKERSRQLIERLNPISVRIKFGDPDGILSIVSPYSNALFSWPIAFCWVVLCVYAAITFASQWERFVSGSVQAASRDGLFWLGLSWFMLKIVHESAHALACKRFEGEVKSFGVLFLLLIPLPFVDVTSAWKLTNKYKRILISAAGMLAELAVASIAVLIWTNTDVGTTNTLASSLILAASLHTLVFNMNPLMRFDGYHILADWLEIPNLGNRGSEYVRNLWKRIMLGTPMPAFKAIGSQGIFIKLYGIAASIWKVLLCVTISLAALSLIPGIGVLLAVFAIVSWLLLPILRFAKSALLSSEIQPGAKRHFVCASLLCTLFIATVAMLPAPTVIRAPFVVDYEGLEVVRAEAAGIVRAVAVQDNQRVQRGDLLITLENPKVLAEIEQLETQRQQSKLRARVHKNDGDVALWQIEIETSRELETKLAELRANQTSLIVKAPVSGQIIARDLDAMVGRYVQVGQELVSIGASDRKEVLALVAQAENDSIQNAKGNSLKLRIWGHDRFEDGVLKEVGPKTRDDLPHFAFAGMYGGPLTVVNRNQMDSEQKLRAHENTELEALKLVESRVQVSVALNPETSQRLLAGQTGVLHLRSRDMTLGSYLYDNGMRWMKKRIAISHGL